MKQFKFIFLAMIIIMSIFPTNAFAENKAINVTIDGVPVTWTDAAPYVDENNRTMVPLSAIANAMRLDVAWDNVDKTATFTMIYDEQNIVPAGYIKDTDGDGVADSFMGASGVVFTLNNNIATYVLLHYTFGADMAADEPTSMDSYTATMDTAAVMKDNRTYAPVKYLAEFYGYTAAWDKTTSTVVLTSEVQQ